MKKTRLRFNRYQADGFRIKKRRLISRASLTRHLRSFSDNKFYSWSGSAKRYFFEPRLRFSRFQLNLFGLTFLSIGLIVGTYFTVSDLIPRLRAATSPWDQTDWSGGDGQLNWSDVTKFSTSGLLVTDTFTDSDGTALTDHTPDQGGTWLAGNGGTLFEISGNKVALSGGGAAPGEIYIPGAVNSFVVEATMTAVSSQWGLIINYASSTDYVVVRYIPGTLYASHGIDWVNYTTTAMTMNPGDVLKVVVTQGSNYEAFVNDVSKLTWSTTDAQNSGKQGLWVFNGGVGEEWDNFSVTGVLVENSVAGEITLARIEELTNTGFETDLSDWTPGLRPDTVSGLKAWYAADQITGLNDSDPVGTWSDLSGNGHNVSNTGTARPTYKTGIQNGLPVVRFDGTDDLLNTSGFGYDGANSEITVFVVGTRRASIVGGGSFVTLSNGEDTYPWQGWSQGAFFWEHQDNGYKLTTRRSDLQNALMDTLTTQDTFNVLAARINSSHHRIYLNGALDGESVVASGAFNSGWFWIGGSPNGAGRNYKQWDIAEVIIYDSALSDTDRNNIETYLSDKYNITVSSPTLVATRDTGTTYNGSVGSAKLVPADVSSFTQAANVGDTNTYNLEVFGYTDGSAVTKADVELFADGLVLGTTYTSVGGGWWKLTGTVTGANEERAYGVRATDGLLVYDSFTGSGGLASHTPDFDKGGGGWTDGGSHNLSGGTVTDPGAGIATIDVGSGDIRVEMRMRPDQYGNGPAIRYSDADNTVYFSVFSTTNIAQIYECYLGSCPSNGVSYTFDSGAYYDFKFEIGSDDVARYYVNGDLVVSRSITQPLTGTLVGIDDGILDDFTVKEIGASSVPVYIDDAGLYSYPASGTLTSSIFDAEFLADWGTLTYTTGTPSGTSVSVKVRTSDSSTMVGAPAFSSCSAISSGSDISANGCVTDMHRYVQYELTLSTTDQAKTPTFEDISIAFSPSDVTPPPTNASAILMFKSEGGSSVSDDGWTNNSDPYFSWTAGADDGGGSGLKGYCLYLGADINGDPATAKGLLGTSPVSTAGTTCQFIVSSVNVDFVNASYKGGTWLSSSSDDRYYLNIKAVDNVGNIFAGASEQFQFRFDNTMPSNPSFISAPGDFISTYEVTITWPTLAPDAASDAHSGVTGLQYKISSSGTWYGDVHSGTQNENDLLANDGVYTTIPTPDYDDLVEGNNTVYFRTWDVAGNFTTTYVLAGIKINTTAPSAPRNLDVNPDTNTVNSFAFTWEIPETYVGQGSNITYCYTVNTLPSLPTCTFTAPGVTSLPADAFANQPGSNTFYLAARDEAGVILYAANSDISFTADTSAPGISTNVEIVDASIKETSAWKLALAWEPPADVGAGVASYQIYRSTTATSCSADEDLGSFSKVATTTGTSFLDSGLSQTDQYYCIKACDSANNCSAVSSTVTEYPTGRWKVPAELTSGPVTSPVTTRRAVVTWTTERESDSKVAFGTASGTYFEEEPSISAQVTSHSITLTNLKPGTTYFYKSKWTDEDGNTGESSERTFTTQAAPTIKDVAVSAINIDSAIVNFTSTNATKVNIYYGPTTSFGGVVEQETAATESRYQIQLANLLDGTKYYYKINPLDTEGEEYDYDIVLDFTTYPRPRITNVRIQEVSAATSTVEVSWESNTTISSIVTFYPLDNPQQSRDVVKLARVAKHKVQIPGLRPSTVYVLVAQGFDAIGNEAVSDSQRFTTATDTRPPVITDVQIETSIQGIGSEARAQVIISWETDEPATGQLEYGVGAGTTYTSKTPEDPSLIFYHLQVITDLSTSEVYHLRIFTKDEAGNETLGTDYIVITPERTDSALDLIITNLAETFRFVGGLERFLRR